MIKFLPVEIDSLRLLKFFNLPLLKMAATQASVPPKGLLLKADPIAAKFKGEVQASLTQAPRKPRLVGILSTDSAPSRNYAEFTKKQCQELGVEFVLKETGAAVSSDLGAGDGVEEAIIEANEDEGVDGIMVC